MRNLSIALFISIFLAVPAQSHAINFSSISKGIAKFFSKAATNPAELKAAAGLSAEQIAKETGEAASNFHIPPQVGVRAAQQTVNNLNNNDEQKKNDILVSILWGVVALSVLYFAFKFLKFIFLKIKARNIVRNDSAEDEQITDLSARTGFFNKVQLLFLKSKKFRILNVPVIYIILASSLLYAFAYENGTYGQYDFKKNRYTGKVYAKSAVYPNSEWVETEYRNIDDAVSSSIINEYQVKLAEINSEMNKIRYEQRIRDINNSYYRPAYIPPITSYSPPSTILPPLPLSSRRADSEYKYVSPATGSKYKYDLSDPADAIMYKVDPAAQVLDRVNPMVKLDRQMGYGGGGIK